MKAGGAAPGPPGYLSKEEGRRVAVYVLLLRGVNVGGAGRLPMADLRGLLEELGCVAVETYIQSGNAVFRFAGQSAVLAEAIAERIAERFGFRPAVLLRGVDAMTAVQDANPFDSAVNDPKTLMVYFLTRPATGANLAAMAALVARGETFQLTEAAFYLYAPGGIGRSALAARVERLLGVPATARNLRTVAALAEMARQLAETETEC